MSNIIDREDFYLYDRPDKKEETRNRLQTIQDIGMTEVGVAQFGIKDIMSGLYIERVWSYSDREFDDYIQWVKELKSKHHD